MLELKASNFVETVNILQQVIQIHHRTGFPIGNVMTKESRASTGNLLDRIDEHIETLDVPVTKLTLEDTRHELTNNEGLKYAEFLQLALTLSKTLTRELTTKRIFVLEQSKADFYEPSEPLFGPEVAAKFPSIAYEIDQAGKCYASDLSTASAFHSLRCLEAGIRAMSRCLGIADPTKAKDKSWKFLLEEIDNSGIKPRWPNASAKMSGDGKIFDELHGSLAAIQNPYRNSTMHLDAVYTGPDALYIFQVVKGLMIRIASRMDESGEKKV